MATYQHNTQRVVRRRIIAALLVGGLALLAGVAFWFFVHVQGERQLTAVDPPTDSSSTEAESTMRFEGSDSMFESAEESTTIELEEIHDNQRRADIDAIHDGLQAYGADRGEYPRLSNLNSRSFRQSAFPDLGEENFLDPAQFESRVVITRTPQIATYAYEPVNDDGYTCELRGRECVNYTVKVLLSDGTEYSRSSEEQ